MILRESPAQYEKIGKITSTMRAAKAGDLRCSGGYIDA
jgi:hypothetical protein